MLFPALVRGIILGAAEHGFLHPLWSEQVLEEWRIAAARKQGPASEARSREIAAAIRSTFPDGMVEAPPDLEAELRLPDAADRHVLAAAIAGGASSLLTFNLGDFPRRVLAGHGVVPRHPDGYLWELLSVGPDQMVRVVDVALSNAGIGTERGRTALKRARLSRLGKAWEAIQRPLADRQ